MTLKYGKPGSVSRTKVNLTLAQFVKLHTCPSMLDGETLLVMEKLDTIRRDAERDYLKAQAEVVS